MIDQKMILEHHYLNIFVDNGIKISLKDFIGKLISILGIRGSGKTNTAAVIAEEFLRYNLPLLIIDTDGEYWTLKEAFDVLLIGPNSYSDLIIDLADKINLANKIAKITYSNKIPVILDVSDYHPAEVIPFLKNYLAEIWNLSNKLRIPFYLIIEEAHEFLPQRPLDYHKEILITLTRFALRGRKRGIGMILVSQRSAKVSKDVLTQAEILFLHKVVHPADLNVYKELLPFKSTEVKSLIFTLKTGEVIFVYKGKFEKRKVRLRKTFHPGYTPYYMNNIEHAKKSENLLKILSKIIDNDINLKNKEKLPKENNIKRKNSSYTVKFKKESSNILSQLIIDESPTKVEDLAQITDRKKALDDAVCLKKDEIKLLSTIISCISKKELNTLLYLFLLLIEYPNSIDTKTLALKLNKKTINISILKKLVRKKIIRIQRIGKKKYYSINPKLLQNIFGSTTDIQALKFLIQYMLDELS